MPKYSLRQNLGLWVTLLLVASLRAFAAAPSINVAFSEEQVTEIVRIAKGIQSVHPKLDRSKYMTYATGIYRASRQYKLDPFILIAIAQQESTFREVLPEGAAGERGICQIRKNWLENTKFKAEFGRQTVADLEKASKNFLFAAWILRELKDDAPKSALPFWSYYNARKFENRFKYYLAVNRNIATLRKNQMMLESVAVNTVSSKRDVASGPVVVDIRPVQAGLGFSLPVTPMTRPLPPLEKPSIVAQNHMDDLRIPPPSRWVPDAVKKLREANALPKARKVSQADKSNRAKMPRAQYPVYVKATYPLPRNRAEVVTD